MGVIFSDVLFSTMALFGGPTCHTQVGCPRICHMNLPYRAGNQATLNLRNFNKSHFTQKEPKVSSPFPHTTHDRLLGWCLNWCFWALVGLKGPNRPYLGPSTSHNPDGPWTWFIHWLYLGLLMDAFPAHGSVCLVRSCGTVLQWVRTLPCQGTVVSQTVPHCGAVLLLLSPPKRSIL